MNEWMNEWMNKWISMNPIIGQNIYIYILWFTHITGCVCARIKKSQLLLYMNINEWMNEWMNEYQWILSLDRTYILFSIMQPKLASLG